MQWDNHYLQGDNDEDNLQELSRPIHFVGRRVMRNCRRIILICRRIIRRQEDNIDLQEDNKHLQEDNTGGKFASGLKIR